MSHNSGPSPQSLVDRLCLLQRQNWLAGRRISSETLLEEHPSLREDGESAFDLIYNEYLIREELGETLDPEEFARRFPAFAARFRRQLELHEALQSAGSSALAVDSTVEMGPPPAAEPEPFAGTERFAILRRLGTGGMGAVYAAYDRHWQQKLALKTLHHVDPVSNERLKREFRVLADLVHPHLVQLYELFDADGRYFFTMELVDGVDFLAGCRTRPDEPQSAPCDLDRLRASLRHLAEGLQFLHGAGRLHCDIKPSNVLVTEEGRVVILDFGLTRWSGTPGALAGSGYLEGTLAYAAPEMLAGRTATAAADWYAVGVLLYVALTGRLPFSGSPAEVLAAKRSGRPVPPREINERIPADLDRLCGALLDPDPERRPSGPDVLEALGGAAPTSRTAPGTADRSAFVGRNEELVHLRAALERVEKGQPAGVLVLGSSGVGKSALAEEFLKESAGCPEMRVFPGRCYERETLRFKALDAVVEALCRDLKQRPPEELARLVPEDWTALVRMFPAFGRLGQSGNVSTTAAAPRSSKRSTDTTVALPADEGDRHGAASAESAVPRRTQPGDDAAVVDRQDLRRRAFRALREFFVRLGREDRVLVLLIDDLQWGDPDSAELLAELFGTAPAPRLLLIACSRSGDDEQSPCVTALRSDGCRSALALVELRLENLAPAEAQELARRQLRESQTSSIRAETVARQSEGNPFLLLELARWMPATDTDRLPGTGGEALVRARVERLPEEPRRLMQVIAVAGHPLDTLDACRAARLTGDRQKALGRLRAERLIRTLPTGEGERAEPYHDRIREGLVAALPPDVRREHHLELARTLEDAEEPDPEYLALHYHDADVPERASRYAGLAAARSAEALAFEEAVRLYRLALQTHSEEPARELSLRRGLADALANAGRGAEAAEEYLHAERLVSNRESRQLRRLAAEQYMKVGLVERGYSVLVPVLEEIGDRLPQAPWAKLLVALVVDRYIQWRGLDFRERRDEEIPEDQRERIELYWTTALAGGIYDYRQGFAFQTLHLLRSLRAGDARQVALGLHMQAGFVAGCSPQAVPRAQQLVRRAEEIGRRLDDPFVLGRCSMSHGYISLLEGRWRDALKHFPRARQTLRETSVRYLHEVAASNLYQLFAYFYLGEFATLSERVLDLLPSEERNGNFLASHWLRTGYGNAAWLARDEPDEARRQLEQSARECPLQRYSPDRFFYELADVNRRLYRGERRTAWDAARTAWRRVRQSGVLGVGLFRIQMRALRASCALAAVGTGADDRRLLRQARRDARKLHRETIRWADPMAELIEAQVAFLIGDRETAADHLHRAIEGFNDLQMAFHAAAARHHLGELLGGEDGDALIREAHSFMDRQNIRNPERMAAIVTPGFAALHAPSARSPSAVASPDLHELSQQVSHASDQENAQQLRTQAAEQYLRAGRFDEGIALFQKTLQEAGLNWPRTPREALIRLLARRFWLRFRGYGFRERSAETIPERELHRIDLCWTAGTVVAMDDLIRGWSFEPLHTLLALRAGEPSRVARALSNEAALACWGRRKRPCLARRLQKQAEALVERIDDPRSTAHVKFFAAYKALCEGDWPQTVQLCEDIQTFFREHCIGLFWEIGSLHVWRLQALFYLGEFAELSRELPRLLEEARTRCDGFSETCLRLGGANAVWLAADDPEEARRQAEEAMRLWPGRESHLQHFLAFFAQIQIDLYQSDGLAAWRRVADTWQTLAASHQTQMELIHLEMLHLRARAGVAALQNGLQERALVRTVRRDARRLKRATIPWGRPLGHLIEAGLAIQDGRHERALDLLRKSVPELDANGMKLYSAAARHSLGELLGGEDGHELIETARAWMEGECIQNPRRMLAMLTPGFAESPSRHWIKPAG